MKRNDAVEAIVREVCCYGEQHFVERKASISKQEALKRVGPDTLRVSQIYQMLRRRTLLSEGRRILEIGIGYGAVAFALARLEPKADIFATEHPGRRYLEDPLFVEALHRYDVTLAKFDLNERVLPWPDGFFDLVVFSETVEHLPPTIVPDIFVEISRVLRQGGHLVATSNNLTSLLHRTIFMRGRTSFLDLPEPLNWAGGTYGHIRLYTVEEMQRLGSRVGLQLAEVEFSDAHMKSYRLSQSSRMRSVGMALLQGVETIASKVGAAYLKEGWHILYRKSYESA